MYDKEIQDIISSRGYKYDSHLYNGLANVVVKIAKDNFFVLKLYPRDYFKKEREKKFIELAQGILPIPQVFDSGDNFLVMDFKDGVSGSIIFSEKNNKNKSREIGSLVGQAVKKLHSKEIDSQFVGFLSEDKLSGAEYEQKESQFEKNSEFLRSLITEQIVNLKKYSLDFSEFQNVEIKIKNDTEKCLIHNDICLKNILFKDDKIVSFLDFEYAMIGSRLFDLAKVHALGIYLAYNTLGKAQYLDFEEYIDGFYQTYGEIQSYQEMKPFFIYVILNYTLFWLSSPLLKKEDRDRILPIHFTNLQRLKDNKEITVNI